VKRVVVGCEEHLAPFMDYHCHAHGAFVAGRGVALVDVDDEERTVKILAGVWYEGWNGANMHIHVAAVPGKQWMNREFLWYTFHYPFVECGVKRLTGWVEESNYEARHFDEHIGFKLETKLKDAAPSGDMLIYVMRKEDCRWLDIRRGQPQPKGH
jgi:hypothetical protein